MSLWRGRFTPVVALGIVMQATKNDIGFLQLIDSGLHSPYCALEKARSLVGHAAQSTMEIVHVSPATVFHVRQALTVEGQLTLVLLNAFLNYGHGSNLLVVSDHKDREQNGSIDALQIIILLMIYYPSFCKAADGEPSNAYGHKERCLDAFLEYNEKEPEERARSTKDASSV